VLEAKLAVILEEFGIDKTGDVLDSAQAGQIFDDLYVDAILHPDTFETSVDYALTRFQEEAQIVQESASILSTTEDLDAAEAQQLIAHPLPYWVERMTVCYLNAYGGQAQRRGQTWNLTWPHGESRCDVVFAARDADLQTTAQHLTLEDPLVRGLAMRLPRVAPGQPIPCFVFPDIPKEIRGFWSLWRIALHTTDWNQQRTMALFLHDDGRTLLPTARFIWDQWLASTPEVTGHIQDNPAHVAFARIRDVAEMQGRFLYESLVEAHQARVAREREKGEYAFAARRRAVERVGLQAVRDHRLAQLAEEEQTWREDLKRMADVQPELVPLLITYVAQAV
jgi:hypothetical protein